MSRRGSASQTPERLKNGVEQPPHKRQRISTSSMNKAQEQLSRKQFLRQLTQCTRESLDWPVIGREEETAKLFNQLRYVLQILSKPLMLHNFL